MAESYYCDKCHKTKADTQFYSSNNLEKYPTGKLRQCKDCITMHVDNWEPETYLWILEECDVPYIPTEWHSLLEKYARDAASVKGTTIIGRYLSKMKLQQWKKYRWKDNEHIQKMNNHKIQESMQRAGSSQAEIDEAIEAAANAAPPPPPAGYRSVAATQSEPANYGFPNDDIPEISFELTEEDKRYLFLKWGRYRPDEWVFLEQLYNDMCQSYDISTAGHIDNLKKVCKCSLKVDQLLDIGDIDGAQKATKMYDTLMKSGKFTAAQNKEGQSEKLNSVAEVVLLIEKEGGFIPRYYVDGPQDKVDYVIQDMQEYTRSLVVEEMNLGNLIEKAIKQIEEDRLKELENEVDDVDDEEAMAREMFGPKKDSGELTLDDYEEFADYEERMRNLDEEDDW